MSQEKRGYFFQDTPDNSRFRAGDEPTEAEFRNLLDSVPFFQEDTSEASTGGKGLVRYATKQEIQTGLGDGVIKSSEAPKVDVFNYNSLIVPTALAVNGIIESVSNTARKVFRLNLTQQFISFLEKATIPLNQGVTGQVLTKESGSNNFSFQDAPVGFNPNGSVNQVVRGDGSYADKYENLLLTGGNTGFVLTKKSSNTGDWEWKEVDTTIDGGTEGQALIKNSGLNGDYQWKNISSFTFQNEGSGEGVYDPTNSTSTDILFRSIVPSPTSVNNVEVNLSSNGENIEIGIPKIFQNGIQLDQQFVNWRSVGSPSSNGYDGSSLYGWIQNLVDAIDGKANV